MTEDKIILDRKAFGALAVESRVKILKALRERRKTLTEVAEELKLSASSTKEHLETLVSAGLIEKIDDGHKWKYYALTKKGSEIVTPEKELRVWVVLGISVIGLVFSALLLLSAPAFMGSSAFTDTSAPKAAAVTAATCETSLTNVTPNLPCGTTGDILSNLTPQLILALVSAIVMIASIAYLVKNKMDSDRLLKMT